MTQSEFDRMCFGKNPIGTLAAAQKALKRMRRNHRGSLFDVYRCKFCGQFHVGHRSARYKGKVLKNRFQRGSVE